MRKGVAKAETKYRDIRYGVPIILETNSNKDKPITSELRRSNANASDRSFCMPEHNVE